MTPSCFHCGMYANTPLFYVRVVCPLKMYIPMQTGLSPKP